MAICFVIAVYYAVIIAWAAMFSIFSFTQAWGDDPEGFPFGEYLQVSEDVAIGFDFVPGVLIPLVIVRAVTLFVLAKGMQRGIARAAVIFLHFRSAGLRNTALGSFAGCC